MSEVSKFLIEEYDNTNHKINEIKLDAPIITNFIKLEVERPMQNVPAAIFQINIE